MFKGIELEHYRSFEHISLDLTGPHDVALNHAFLYGENGSGKSDLIGSIRFLKDSVNTLSTERDGADATGLKFMAASHRMIGREERMRTSYRFTVGSLDTSYEMVFDADGSLIHEELRQDSGKRMRRLFLVESSVGGPEIVFARGLFDNPPTTREVSGSASRQWGTHSMLSIIRKECLENGRGCMDRCIGDILDYIDSIATDVPSSAKSASSGPVDLVSGTCPIGDRHLMEAYAHALSRFFGRLYSDIVGARYVFIGMEDSTLGYDLVFDKRIAGNVCEIPARLESSGTKSLISVFPSLLECAGGGVAFIDGLDIGVHEKLIRDLVNEILPGIRGQLIATIHNTTLLETVNPRNAFVLRVDPEGFKEILSIQSICRTQKNHNNRQRYLNGQFDAVPVIGVVDMEGICEGFAEDLKGRYLRNVYFGLRKRQGPAIC